MPYSIDRPLLFLGILLVIIGIQIFSIGFILSDFFLGLGSILMIGGAVFLALKFIKEDRDDAKDEPFRGIDE